MNILLLTNDITGLCTGITGCCARLKSQISQSHCEVELGITMKNHLLCS